MGGYLLNLACADINCIMSISGRMKIVALDLKKVFAFCITCDENEILRTVRSYAQFQILGLLSPANMKKWTQLWRADFHT